MSQPAPQEECAAEGIRQRAEINYPKGVIYPITVHGMKGAMEDLAATQRRAEESEKREQELQREFLHMRNRAELAEKSALDLKAIADHLQRQRAADNDAHGKDIAELQKALGNKAESFNNTQARLENAIKERDEYAKVAAELQRENERLGKQLDAYGVPKTRTSHSKPEPHDYREAMKHIADLNQSNRQMADRIAEPTRQRDKAESELTAIKKGWAKPIDIQTLTEQRDSYRSELERINTLCAELTRQRDDWMRRSEEYKDEAITENAEKGIQELLKNRALEKIAELTRQRDETLELASKRRDEIESLVLLLRAYGHDITGTNPVTKDEQEAATNLPVAGKPDPENQLEACERENDRLRLVIDSIQNILSLADEQ